MSPAATVFLFAGKMGVTRWGAWWGEVVLGKGCAYILDSRFRGHDRCVAWGDGVFCSRGRCPRHGGRMVEIAASAWEGLLAMTVGSMVGAEGVGRDPLLT